jgi:hypothetical protein
MVEGPCKLSNGVVSFACTQRVQFNYLPFLFPLLSGKPTFFITIPFWRIIKSFFLLNFQLATNTLERVAPLTHAVGNVLKRVFVIGFSILIFGNDLSTT